MPSQPQDLIEEIILELRGKCAEKLGEHWIVQGQMWEDIKIDFLIALVRLQSETEEKIVKEYSLGIRCTFCGVKKDVSTSSLCIKCLEDN